MKFSQVEHHDRFADEMIFWVEISDPPKEIQDKAREIDGSDYNPSCFGLCVFYSMTSKEYDLISDWDNVIDECCSIYYIDNDGDKHWFAADIPDALLQEIYTACNAIIAEGKIVNENEMEPEYYDTGLGLSM